MPQPPKKRFRVTSILPGLPADPQESEPRASAEQEALNDAVIRVFHWWEWLKKSRTLRLGLLSAGAAAILAGGYAALALRPQHRTVSVCVMTDASYRAERPDWRTALPALFQQVNGVFRGTGVSWTWSDGGDAYPAEIAGTMAERERWLENSGCRADVILGLTGHPDRDANAAVTPFSHSLLVADSAAQTDGMAATIVARSLARLFGAPRGTRTLLLSDQPDGEILDGADLRTIRSMSGYPFAAGAAGLAGMWEKRAAATLAGALSGKAAHPRSEAHAIVASVLASAGRPAEAALHLREALRDDPHNADLRLTLALELEANLDTRQAIAELQTAARDNPRDARTHAALGMVLWNGNRTAEAIAELRTAANLDPGNTSYQTALGQALSALPGEVREADRASETAASLPSSQGGAPAAPAAGNARNHFPPLLKKELRESANSPEVHVRAAIEYALAGEADAAESELRRAIGLQASSGPAHMALARLLYRRGRYGEADAELRAAEGTGVAAPQAFAGAIRRGMQAGDTAHRSP